MWSTNPRPGHYPKELTSGSRRDICTPILIVAWFTRAKMWKQPKCAPMDEEYVHTYVGIFFGYKNEILSYVATRMNLEDVTPSEISQSQKDIYGIIPLIWNISSSEYRRSRKRHGSWQGWNGRGNGKLLFNLLREQISYYVIFTTLQKTWWRRR